MPSWHCQCKNGLRKASPPQNLPFLLPGVLLLHSDATQCFLNDPEAGLGLHQLGGGAQQWLAWKLEVGRST